jgi:hypothetical protein
MDSVNRSAAVFVWMLAAAWLVFTAAVYLPDVGRGFVKDDFQWVDAGRAALAHPAAPFVRPRADFYRPLVELTFAVDYLTHALQPRGFGFTNLLLYVLCVVALWSLGRTLRLSPAASALATLVWAANPHGINMAVVWISGRTSLCAMLFATLAAIAALHRRPLATSILVAAALASKEEAIALPFVLAAWQRLAPHREEPRDPSWPSIDGPMLVALTVPTLLYLMLRAYSGAMTPWSAPPYYRFTVNPAVVARNLLEYGDRSLTITAVTIALILAVFQRLPKSDERDRRLLAACALWFAGSFASTLLLPIRSSLYAVLPSTGAALACGVVLDAMTRGAVGTTRLFTLGGVMALILIGAIPVYRERNWRYVEPARLSNRALRTLAPEAAAAPPGTFIVLHDAGEPPSNFVGAFGTFATPAVRLYTGRDVNVWIDPPPEGWQNAGVPPLRPQDVRASFQIDRGRVVRVGP